MHKMMYKKEELYLTTRNSIFYFVRRVPRDLIQYYSSNRISFSLKTKSKLKALRVSSTVKQKLEDYWLVYYYTVKSVSLTTKPLSETIFTNKP